MIHDIGVFEQPLVGLGRQKNKYDFFFHFYGQENRFNVCHSILCSSVIVFVKSF